MDYVQWNDSCSQVLWLSGPPECNINQVSSYIMGQEKDTTLKTGNFVLYFFCSDEIRGRSVTKYFVHTLVYQICCSSTERSLLIFQSFLRNLLNEAFEKKAAPNWKEQRFNERELPNENLQKLLDAPANELLTALGALLDEEQQGLSIIIDGLDKVKDQRDEFIRGVRKFVEHLQQRTLKVKVLLTSRPVTEIKALLDGLPRIEHDRERKGSSASNFLIRD
jgi:hypothetical protein